MVKRRQVFKSAALQSFRTSSLESHREKEKGFLLTKATNNPTTPVYLPDAVIFYYME
jgi:hypothetical protein